MTVKLTLGELKDAEKGLGVILTAGLPIKMSYTLQKGLRAINTEFKNFEEERNNLIKKHQKEEGKGVEPGSEEFVAFMADYNELSKVEVEVWFSPMKIEELEKEGVKISPVELLPLMGKFVLED